MSRATIADVQKNLTGFLERARREPVEIEDNGIVVARLVSGYDPDDEDLMAWLSLPETKARFEASRERAARGETVRHAAVLRELGITEDELSAERSRLG